MFSVLDAEEDQSPAALVTMGAAEFSAPAVVGKRRQPETVSMKAADFAEAPQQLVAMHAREFSGAVRGTPEYEASHRLPTAGPLKPGETRDRGVFVGDVPLELPEQEGISAGIPGMGKLGGTPPGPPSPPLPTAIGVIGVESLDRQPQASRINPRTGLPMREGSGGPLTITDAFTSGGGKVVRGIERVAEPLQSFVIGKSGEPGMPRQSTLTPEQARELAKGGTEIIGGAMDAVTPLIPGGVATSPVTTLRMLAIATAADTTASAGLKAAGVPEEYADFVGAVAAVMAVGKGAKSLYEKVWKKAGSPRIEFGPIETPKEFADMTDAELLAHANKVARERPSNAEWQQEQIAKEVLNRRAGRGMGSPEGARPEPTTEPLAEAQAQSVSAQAPILQTVTSEPTPALPSPVPPPAGPSAELLDAIARDQMGDPRMTYAKLQKQWPQRAKFVDDIAARMTEVPIAPALPPRPTVQDLLGAPPGLDQISAELTPEGLYEGTLLPGSPDAISHAKFLRDQIGSGAFPQMNDFWEKSAEWLENPQAVAQDEEPGQVPAQSTPNEPQPPLPSSTQSAPPPEQALAPTHAESSDSGQSLNQSAFDGLTSVFPDINFRRAVFRGDGWYVLGSKPGMPDGGPYPTQSAAVQTLIEESKGLPVGGRVIDSSAAESGKPVAEQSQGALPGVQPKQKAAPAVPGKSAEVYTIKGRKVSVQYQVRSADDLVNSFDAGYPQRYQPRQTDRAATEQRIAQREGDMEFDLMADSRLASDGAPIILNGGVIVTRNHGTEALKRLYAGNKPLAQRYRQDLIDNAAAYGADPETVAATPKPVLTRVIQDEMAPEDVVEFAQEANMSSAARMSDAEMATFLAKRMTGPLMDSFDPGESGKPNIEFVREVIKDLPVEEQGVFMNKSGKLSPTGATMVRNAIFAKAYPDPRVLERMVESENDSLRNISNAMLAAAPKVAQLQEAVSRGDRFDLGIAQEIADAANVMDGLAKKKTSIADWKLQGDIPGQERDPVVAELVSIFAENRRSAKRIAEFLKEYTEVADDAGSPKQETMFGPPQVPNKAEIVAVAYERAKAKREVVRDIFGDEEVNAAPAESPGVAEGKGPAAGRKEGPAEPEARRVKPQEGPSLFPPESDQEALALTAESPSGGWRQTKIIETIPAESEGTQVEIAEITGGYSVGLRDVDSGEMVGATTYPTRAAALAAGRDLAAQSSMFSPGAAAESKAAAKTAQDKLTGQQLTAQFASGMAVQPSKLKSAETRNMFDEESEQEGLFARRGKPDPNQLSLFDEGTITREDIPKLRAPGEPPRRGFQFDPATVESIPEPNFPQAPIELGQMRAYWGGAKVVTKTVAGTKFIFVNQPAMDVVLRRIGGKNDSAETVLGKIAGPNQWGRLVDAAREAQADPRPGGFDDALVQIGNTIVDHMGEPGAVAKRESATDSGDHKNLLVIVQAGTKVKRPVLKSVVEEELDHIEQRRLPEGFRGLPVEILDTEEGKAALDGLAKIGYPRPNPESPFYAHNRAIAAAEVGVRLMRPGRWKELGVTAQQAGDLAKAYIEGLDRHGEKAITIIDQIRDAVVHRIIAGPAGRSSGASRDAETAARPAERPGDAGPGVGQTVPRLEANRGQPAVAPFTHSPRVATTQEAATPEPTSRPLPNIDLHGQQPIVKPPAKGESRSQIAMQPRAFGAAPSGPVGVYSRASGPSGPIPSPSYDQTKQKILDHVPLAKRAELEQRMKEWEAAHPEREVVSFADIEREAKALDPRLVLELKKPGRGQTLDPALRFAAREALNGINDEALKRGTDLTAARGSMAPEQIVAEERKIDKLKRSGQDLLDILIATRSQDGRNLAYHAMMAKQSFSDEYWIGRARTIAGGALPQQTILDLQNTLREGREAERSETAGGLTAARIKLAQQMANLEKTGLLDTISALRKAGLLTGFKTSVRNIGGNLTFQVLEETTRFPAALLDSAMSVFTGERTVQGPSLPAMARASHAGITKGVVAAIETMRHGATKEQLSKLDVPREVNSGSKVIDFYTNGVFRFMSAQDQLFRKYAIERSLSEQSALMEKNGKGSAAYWKANPTTEMEARAVSDSEYATFNNRNLIADLLSGARQAARRAGPAGRAVDFALDMTVPFVKTPSNIIARLFDYTPLGPTFRVPIAVARAIEAKEFTAEQQHAIATAIARGLVGTALIYIGARLYQNGRMTGVRNPESVARDEAVGREPGSLLVDGKWRQVSAFSPTGNLLTLGASIAETATKPLKDEAKRLDKYALIGAKTVMEQPFLKGINDLIEALNNPGRRAAAVASSMAGSFVPTVLADIAAESDPFRRQPEGMGEAIKARLPGLRKTVPERVDVLGHTLKQESVLDPTIPSTARELTDPLAQELVRTQVGLSKTPRQPARPYKVNGKTYIQTAESRDEYRARAKLMGRLIEAAATATVNSSIYQDTEDVDTRRLLLEKAIHKGRSEMVKLTGNHGFKVLPTEQRTKIYEGLLEKFR